MPRRKLIRTNKFPYHITARANNKEWFYLPIEIVWLIFTSRLGEAIKKFNIQVESCVLMNNHFHLLVWTPENNIDLAMQFIMKTMADKINFRAGRINHVFGGPYKWCLITEYRYYANVVRYIAQNPLRAGLVSRVEDYPYQILPGPDIFGVDLSPEEFLGWLNMNLSSEESDGLSKATKKRVFHVGRCAQTSKPYRIDAVSPKK